MVLRKKAPTIQDVAKFANVSTATVSRALSAPDQVTEKTRSRVDEAIRMTGYKVNLTARSLRRRAGNTILVALPNVGNTFFTPIVDEIERTASARGYSVLLSNRRAAADEGAELMDFFLSNRADGLLLFDGTTDVAALRGNGNGSFPTIVVCEAIPQSGLPTVKSDNRGASRMVVRHLLELGHNQIGHLTSPRYNVLRDERTAGVRDELAEAGLALRSEWQLEGDFTFDSGASAAEVFLQLNERPTAMVCDSDNMAIGFLSVLRSHGIACPRDISVVGFDDIPIAAHFHPRLTTVRQQQRELGRISAEMLLDALEASVPVPSRDGIVLPCELIVRESSGPVPSVAGR